MAVAQPLNNLARSLKALGDDTRLSIVRLLASTDMTAGEIQAQVGAPQNMVSYHLRMLRSLGLLRDRRSSRDARDVYYSVDLNRLQRLYQAIGAALHEGLAANVGSQDDTSSQPIRVLFLCTHNSARSQLAEGLLRKLGGKDVEVWSAGNDPLSVHPLTVWLLDEWDIDPSGHVAKDVASLVSERFDYVITVCDKAREHCPSFPGNPKRMHWSLPDPLAVDDPEEQLRVFRTIGDDLTTRVRYFLLGVPSKRNNNKGGM
ncbi:MAG: Glutaredoxin arsenate reductase [Nitrospira sp.]|nr:Glutaredoxin arsenate reductase [Nitrospira sp.]